MHSDDITRLLSDARDGDPAALERVLPAVYAELRSIARRQGFGAGDHTLGTTALVNEAYLKVFAHEAPEFADRRHFYSVVCLAMRQLLRDHARKHGAQKRGGENSVLSLDRTGMDVPAVELDIDSYLDLDAAMGRLDELDPRLSEVVQLRFFGGLTVDEIAALRDVTTRTVLRDWRKARAFLIAELGDQRPG
ncbi:MAG TPA: ECF-type sigma factor [Candidatus Krumholzibacteria bacterium]